MVGLFLFAEHPEHHDHDQAEAQAQTHGGGPERPADHRVAAVGTAERVAQRRRDCGNAAPNGINIQ